MFGEDERTDEQKEYGKFRHKFALAMVLITLGGPVGIFFGIILLINQGIKRPGDLMEILITPIVILLFAILMIFILFITGG